MWKPDLSHAAREYGRPTLLCLIKQLELAVRTSFVTPATPRWDLDQASTWNEETTSLIAEATAPGTDRTTVLTDGRKVALTLSTTHGLLAKRYVLATVHSSFISEGVAVNRNQLTAGLLSAGERASETLLSRR
ncbi:hypothetical protein [Amycolatopsis taiwanensis]|uniref:hypothetical protein n=1 Tax=Amycolatopsis taiwanensis TaxID=342230 RepID=UPI0012EBEDFB|nr:hypothetical protein [Amycolatopsis taiwanensis]